MAGTVDSQFDLVKDSEEVKKLLTGINEIWVPNTAGLRYDNVIFTHQLWPERDRYTNCSLNIIRGEFWRLRE